MFLCKECHGPNDPYRFECDEMIGFPSRGACERCHKGANCIDCYEREHGKIPVAAVEPKLNEPEELDCAA